jgi:hypothetical protein
MPKRHKRKNRTPLRPMSKRAQRRWLDKNILSAVVFTRLVVAVRVRINAAFNLNACEGIERYWIVAAEKEMARGASAR